MFKDKGWIIFLVYFCLTGKDFAGDVMNTIDMILSQIGKADDGLGPNWSPLERVVHKFHMQDLWSKLKSPYQSLKGVKLVIIFLKTA